MEIAIENLTKLYGKQKAIDNISFNLYDGEILGFLGPNGAGKTTTMRIISCFLAPTSGNVSVDGKSVFESPQAFKLKIGYLPENNPLYKDMYIPDYLKFIARLQQVPNSLINNRIKEVIKFTGLDLEINKRIEELSKGYRQRVGLAQSLINDPEILILDEPTSGLDPNQIIEIRDLIKNLGKTKTILLSTHILQEVEAVCDRVIIINRGKIVADAPKDKLYSQIKNETVITLQVETDRNSSEIIDYLKQIKYITHLELTDEKDLTFRLSAIDGYLCKKELFLLCVNKNMTILELNENKTKLEDIFRMLTSN